MGQELSLFVYDESIESPYLSRGFKDEIIFASYINFKDFLTQDEAEIIAPNTYGEIVLSKKREPTILEKAKLSIILHKALNGKITADEINNLRGKLIVRSEKVGDRERDPNRLQLALKLTEKYLMDNCSELPLVHSVYLDKGLTKEIGQLEINSIKAHIEGDLFYYKNYADFRNKIHVKSYLEDYGKVDFLIEVKPEIEIAGNRYFTKSITKEMQFQDDFKKCYDFLDSAIKKRKKVLWEIG